MENETDNKDSEIVAGADTDIVVPGEDESKMLSKAESSIKADRCKAARMSGHACKTDAPPKPTRKIVLNNELEIVVSKGDDSFPSIFHVRRRCTSIVEKLAELKSLGFIYVISIFETENEDKSEPLQEGDSRFKHDIIEDMYKTDSMPIDEVISSMSSHFIPPSKVIRDLQIAIERASIWSDLDVAIVGISFSGGVPASFAFISPESDDLGVRVCGDLMDEQTDKFKDAMRRSRKIAFANDKVTLL